MANENQKMMIPETEFIDYNELETILQTELDSDQSELQFLNEEREKIGSPENLGKVIGSVVWEQFLNQIATTAGEDFIEENRGLTLDLRADAHIQTTENFEKELIATHNREINYHERYDNYKYNFQKDDNGVIKKKYDPRSNDYKKVLTKDSRQPFDKGRDIGSATRPYDHVVPVAEINRDPEAYAHVDKKRLIEFANSDKNLQPLDSAANQSKGDRPVNEWLSHERNGKKPGDRFNIDESELREKDKMAREEYKGLKEEGKNKSIATGKKSQKEEAFRITGKALRAVIMQLLAELMKDIIRKLVVWLKKNKKSLESLLDSINSAIKSFIANLKKHLINAGSTILTTIVTAIFGPIVRTIKKVWVMLKQGWKSLKEAVDYIKKPINKGKSFSILILEVGKIVIAGLSAVSAIALGELIEKSLMAIPLFAIEIPFLGSLASLVGLFVGGLVAGIIGAIAINLIDRAVVGKQKTEAIQREIKKGNEILNKQNSVKKIKKIKLEKVKNDVGESIQERHKHLKIIIQDSLSKLNDTNNEVANSGNEDNLTKMLENLKKITN